MYLIPCNSLSPWIHQYRPCTHFNETIRFSSWLHFDYMNKCLPLFLGYDLLPASILEQYPSSYLHHYCFSYKIKLPLYRSFSTHNFHSNSTVYPISAFTNPTISTFRYYHYAYWVELFPPPYWYCLIKSRPQMTFADMISKLFISKFGLETIF